MIYEVCPICAALTTDIDKHIAWHEVPQPEEAADANNERT